MGSGKNGRVECAMTFASMEPLLILMKESGENRIDKKNVGRKWGRESNAANDPADLSYYRLSKLILLLTVGACDMSY